MLFHIPMYEDLAILMVEIQCMRICAFLNLVHIIDKSKYFTQLWSTVPLKSAPTIKS